MTHRPTARAVQRRAPVAPPLFGGPRGGRRRPSFGYYSRRAFGDVDATFSAAVEAWRSLVTQYAGDLPVNFLLKWISVESGGNACDYTTLRESGIFQLMYPDNLTTAGTSEALYHPSPPCTPGTRTIVPMSQLSDDQAKEQVRAGIQYVNAMRAKAHAILDAAGIDWPESSSSFWSMVKMMHVAPAPVPMLLAAATAQLGGAPPDWATWAGTVTSLPASWLANATEVGALGEGGGSMLGFLADPLVLAGLAGGGALLYYVMRRRYR